MQILSTIKELRAHVQTARAEARPIALVPTMGALHAGHAALVKAAVAKGTHIIVSIFVNPTQFAPTEDLSSYPRTLDADIAMVESAGAHAVYAPGVSEMYGSGFCTTVRLAGPATAGLEDRFRPTHFEGVATVVTKLLTQCLPDYATFGVKDYQQLQVVTQLVADLDLPTQILPVETLRDADGLALSSRNVYLSPAERSIAPTLHHTMRATAERISAGEAIDAACANGIKALTKAGFAVDYLEVRDARTLAAVPDASASAGRALRMLAAARLGRTRLIDNIAV